MITSKAWYSHLHLMKIFSKRKSVFGVPLPYLHKYATDFTVSCKNENGELNLVLSYVSYHTKTGTWFDVATTV